MNGATPVSIGFSGNGSFDDLLSLRTWLHGEDELRGRVTPHERPPGQGELGTIVDMLVVSVGPGGAVAALAAGVLSWLRSRTSDIDLEITKPDGSSVKISAKRVRKLNPEALRREIDKLCRALDS